MSSPSENTTYTYRDWLTWTGQWELINGKAYNMTPAPSSFHQFIVGELHFALRTFFQNQRCYVFTAPFDVLLSEKNQYDTPDHVIQPDLTIVCSKNQIFKNGCHGAPAFIIEVLSPATALKDYNEKFNLYQKFGVHEYWIVDPGHRTVHVFASKDGTYSIQRMFTEQDTIQSLTFQELTIPAEKVFTM